MADGRGPLSEIDWNFSSVVSDYGVHGIHWYPASFIPQIPAYLIELLSAPGDLVVDPFVGAGTTLVEAMRLGRRSVGMDVNPVACLISQAKLILLTKQDWRSEAELFIRQLEADRLGLELQSEAGLEISAQGLPESIELARAWYHPATFRQLVALRNKINSAPDPVSTLYLAAFSHILKRASNQIHHWGYVADNMIPRQALYRDAFELFIRSLRALVDTQRDVAWRGAFDEDAQSSVLLADSRVCMPMRDAAADLVLTSPPYAGVTDYTTAHRLSMYWLDEKVSKVRDREIGARWKRFRQPFISQYIAEMHSSFTEISRVVRDGGHLALVVGAPERRDKEHAIVETLESMLPSLGFEFVERALRTPSRKRVVDRWGTTNQEWIIVFQKRG